MPSNSCLPEAIAKFAILGLQPRELHRVFERHQQFVGRKRLLEEIHRPELCRVNGHFNVGLTGNQDNRRLYSGFFQVFEKFDSRLTRHHHVGKNEVEIFAANQIKSASGVVAHSRFMTGEPERTRKRCQSAGIVIDNQQMRFFCHRKILARRGVHIELVARICQSDASANEDGSTSSWNLFRRRRHQASHRLLPRRRAASQSLQPGAAATRCGTWCRGPLHSRR